MLVRTPDWQQRVRETLENHAVADGTSPIRHTRQVTSYGGSGTTALCRHFANAGLDMPGSPDHWPWKHTRTPPAAHDVPDDFRVVYVYADPREAVLSLFRRGLQVGAYRVFHLERPSESVERRLETLDRYLDAGVDDFGLLGHLENWLHHPSGYPVLFLDFDALPDAWPVVRDFVGLPEEYPCLDVRPRRSPLAQLEPSRAARLTAMYQPLLDIIDALPRVHLVP